MCELYIGLAIASQTHEIFFVLPHLLFHFFVNMRGMLSHPILKVLDHTHIHTLLRAHTCTHTQSDGAECAAMWCEDCLSRIRRSVVGVKSHVLLMAALCVVSSVVTVSISGCTTAHLLHSRRSRSAHFLEKEKRTQTKKGRRSCWARWRDARDCCSAMPLRCVNPAPC